MNPPCPKCGATRRIAFGHSMELHRKEGETKSWAECWNCGYVWQWRGPLKAKEDDDDLRPAQPA